MWQVRVEIERRNPGKPSARIQIPYGRQRSNLIRLRHHREAQAPSRFSTGTPSPFMQRARVQAEAFCCLGTNGSPWAEHIPFGAPPDRETRQHRDTVDQLEQVPLARQKFSYRFNFFPRLPPVL